MKNNLVICLILSFCVSFVVGSQYKQYYISKYCSEKTRHETIELDEDESAIVITSGEDYRNFMNCSVSVKADKGYAIIVTVRRVSLRNIVDKLAIDVTQSIHPEWTGSAVDPKQSVSYVGDRKIKIKFSTQYSREPTRYKDFVLILTSYRPSDNCRESEISCGTKQCISSTFLCDGHNNCGDNSDEILCLVDQQWNHLGVIGTAMAALVVFLLLCYCCRCCCCCCGSKKNRNDYIPVNGGADRIDFDKVETTFTEESEPTAPIGSQDYFNYGVPHNSSVRYPPNPNYPFIMDTMPRPESDRLPNYMPPPPPYTPK